MPLASVVVNSPSSFWPYVFATVFSLGSLSLLGFLGRGVFRYFKARDAAKETKEAVDKTDHELLVEIYEAVFGRKATPIEEALGRAPPRSISQQVVDLTAAVAHLHECFETKSKSSDRRLAKLEEVGG